MTVPAGGAASAESSPTPSSVLQDLQLQEASVEKENQPLSLPSRPLIGGAIPPTLKADHASTSARLGRLEKQLGFLEKSWRLVENELSELKATVSMLTCGSTTFGAGGGAPSSTVSTKSQSPDEELHPLSSLTSPAFSTASTSVSLSLIGKDLAANGGGQHHLSNMIGLVALDSTTNGGGPADSFTQRQRPKSSGALYSHGGAAGGARGAFERGAHENFAATTSTTSNNMLRVRDQVYATEKMKWNTLGKQQSLHSKFSAFKVDAGMQGVVVGIDRASAANNGGEEEQQAARGGAAAAATSMNIKVRWQVVAKSDGKTPRIGLVAPHQIALAPVNSNAAARKAIGMELVHPADGGNGIVAIENQPPPLRPLRTFAPGDVVVGDGNQKATTKMKPARIKSAGFPRHKFVPKTIFEHGEGGEGEQEDAEGGNRNAVNGSAGGGRGSYRGNKAGGKNFDRGNSDVSEQGSESSKKTWLLSMKARPRSAFNLFRRTRPTSAVGSEAGSRT